MKIRYLLHFLVHWLISNTDLVISTCACTCTCCFGTVLATAQISKLLTRLFHCCREIQEKYKLTLTRDAVLQFTRAADSNRGALSRSVFAHAQYDVLRRLRVYWLPRYLLHKDYLNQLGSVQLTWSAVFCIFSAIVLRQLL